MSDATILQGTPEWRLQRLGKASASRISDIISTTKSGYSNSRGNYMADLLCERLTGEPAKSFTTIDMRWGTDTEPFARDTYAFYRDVSVQQVGFLLHPSISDAGASPDGLVGDNGLVEIKCPLTATHIETVLSDNVPTKYIPQMQFQLAVTGRAWCDFVSFDPRLPEEMRLFVKRVERDDRLIEKIESEVRKFLAELDAKIAALKSKFGVAEAA